MEEEYAPQDSMRLCPTCRMAISVLATRCRFCGEEVGRPRQGERLFTIEDLGGDNPANYTVSGNVLDALESFRAEQLSTQELARRDREERSKSWIGRRGGEPLESPIDSGSGLPELDARHRTLADIVESSSPKRPALRRPGWQDDLKTYGLYGAGVVVAVAILFFAWQAVANFIEARNRVEEVVIPNNTLTLLEAGEPLQALEEAMSVLRQAPTDENRGIAETARIAVIEQVEGLLNDRDWNRGMLDQASRIATRAATIDPERQIQELQQTVDEEVAAYKMILISVNDAEESATFRLHNPNYPEAEQTVQAGDWVQDRFIVRRVYSNYVRLEDTKRTSRTGNRGINARLNSPIVAE